MKKLAYQHTFWNRTTDIAEEYSSKLVEFCQPSLGVTQTFFSSGGSDAAILSSSSLMAPKPARKKGRGLVGDPG